MSDCRVAFVGAGGVAARHARHLAELPDVVVSSVTDPAAPAADAFSRATGAAVLPDVSALVADRPDAVYVCVPPHAHGPIEETIVGAGIPMFVEKPLGTDPGTARRIAGLVAQAGVTTAVGHHWRYSSAVALARDVLGDKAVRLAVASWLDRVPPVAWWCRRDLSGGQIVEQAVHVLDMLRYLVGEVCEVSAYANAAPPSTPDADVDGATAATLRFASGAIGTVATACCLGWKHLAGIDLHADGVSVAIREDGVAARTADGPVRCDLDPDDAKRAADRAFVDAVMDRGARSDGVLVDYADALRTHELACAIAQAAVQRRPVTLRG